MVSALTPSKFYKHCPKCGSRLVPSAGVERPRCHACSFVFYQNPHPGTCAIVTNERGEVLLVRRAREPRKGTWDFPGGFVDWGETAEQSLVRELREELGVTFTPQRLFGVYHDWYDYQGLRLSVLLVYYLGTIAGEPHPASDVAEVGWFALDRLPGNLAFDHVRQALRDYAAALSAANR